MATSLLHVWGGTWLWQSNYCFSLQVHVCKELFSMWLQLACSENLDTEGVCGVCWRQFRVWTSDRNSTWWDLCLASRDLINNDIWYLISMSTLPWNGGFLLSRYGRTEHGETCSWHYQKTSRTCSIDKLKSKKLTKTYVQSLYVHGYKLTTCMRWYMV